MNLEIIKPLLVIILKNQIMKVKIIKLLNISPVNEYTKCFCCGVTLKNMLKGLFSICIDCQLLYPSTRLKLIVNNNQLFGFQTSHETKEYFIKNSGVHFQTKLDHTLIEKEICVICNSKLRKISGWIAKVCEKCNLLYPKYHLEVVLTRINSMYFFPIKYDEWPNDHHTSKHSKIRNYDYYNKKLEEDKLQQ